MPSLKPNLFHLLHIIIKEIKDLYKMYFTSITCIFERGEHFNVLLNDDEIDNASFALQNRIDKNGVPFMDHLMRRI